MISASPEYKAAVVADARRMLLRAVVDIVDPDLAWADGVPSGGEAWPSRPEQIRDKVFASNRYASLEPRRWLLDDSFAILPADKKDIPGQIGFWGSRLCDGAGRFSPASWAELPFRNVSILQACSVYFSDDPLDGVAEDFAVEVKQGGVARYRKEFTGNKKRSVSLFGFTVIDPDAIRVTVTKWSRPSRRMRIVEIVPGVYEEWDGGMIAQFSAKHQGDISCLTLPYGTCSLRMDNQNRRFEPRSKDGLFQSLEERQGIDVSLAARLPDGTDEYKKLGRFFQYAGGWKTGDNGLTMQWDLVDIIGLLAGRRFLPPASLPTTLEGWLEAICGQLGQNFAKFYTVDPAYAQKEVRCRERKDVEDITCGDLLRYVCMASGTWPRADAETGRLTAEPLWNQGNTLTLDNLEQYPAMKSNEDLAAIVFTVNDGSNDGAGSQVVVSGNNTASSRTETVNNPFLRTQAQALAAARQILAASGGLRLETLGRGDPAGEIGDVDVVWLDQSSAVSARRIQQEFDFSGGVLKGCASVLLQADGSFLYQQRAVLTQSGTFAAPAGATRLRLILVGGGQSGQNGTPGTWNEAGTDGEHGQGGRVWSGTIACNPGQVFAVTIGQGAAHGQPGGDTAFGPYSSADGQFYPAGYTDIASGQTYARAGVKAPLPGSGDGGAGGKGGIQGQEHTEEANITGTTLTWYVIDNFPGPGEPGAAGQSGCAAVFWDK